VTRRGVQAILLAATFLGDGADAQTPSSDARHDAEVEAILTTAFAGRSAAHAHPRAAACRKRSHGNDWPGLVLRDNRVNQADVLAEIVGFGQLAGTTGGLGGTLEVITTTADFDSRQGEPEVPGSLRAAVDGIARRKSPGWIVFDPSLGAATIRLVAPLRLPDDITLDGTCSDITLTAAPEVGLIYVFEHRNVIVTGLALRKTNAVGDLADDKIEGCMRINGFADAIAVLHMDFAACGDGALDITVSPGRAMPGPGRLTVAFNLFRDHDKTMLFGTTTCRDGATVFGDGCDIAQPAPVYALTLTGNLFLQTGQRHPRVFGRVYAHVTGNAIIFRQQQKTDGTFGSSYGTFVSNGAKALVENNVFLSLGRNSHPSAVWTTISPGAERMLEDSPGAIRARSNLHTARETVSQNAPELVADPPYRAMMSPTTTDMPLAIRCIAGRAGRGGAARWRARDCATR
jgi:pectate lyase